jgi:hypothetical protein
MLQEPVFSRVSLTPEIPMRINLSRRVAVILDAPPFHYTVSTSENTPESDSASSHVRLTGESLSLSADEPTVLPLWLLPEGFCGVTVVLSTAHFLHLKARSVMQRQSICFFTQSEFNRADVAVTFKSSDHRASVTFHGADGGGDWEECRLSEKCRFRSDRPFLLRIRGDAMVSSVLTLEYKVIRPAPDAECAIKTIQFAKQSNRETFEQIFQATWRCRSGMADAISALECIGLALLGAFLIAVCHKRWKAASEDRLFPDSENERFATLKRAPFAVPLGNTRSEGLSSDE